jgi:hypothetical protein
MPLVSEPSALPVYAILPFGHAAQHRVLPLWTPHWWENNRNKLVVSAALGLPVLVLYAFRKPGALLHMGEDYVSFIVLLAGLFVISGGVLLRGDLTATPLVNSAFLAVGAMLASAVGTTGASMLLIRPLLQTNRERTRRRHTVVFFIFLVSNVGGMLTPLGDPPLFLGYLEGVPFTWTLRLWPQWLVLTGALLLIYFVWDSIAYAREPLAALRRDRAQIEPLRLRGATNAIWLAGVILSVAFLRAPLRESVIVLLAAASLWRTPAPVRRANGFTWYPIIEVAALFLGIFLTMIPALELLRLRGGELGCGPRRSSSGPRGRCRRSWTMRRPIWPSWRWDRAWGWPRKWWACRGPFSPPSVWDRWRWEPTPISETPPNFMVKSIADEAGVKMPSFFGYMLYSGAVLIPLFVLVTLLFF